MSVEKIISEWQQKSFKPVYWLEGEEPYFIDKIVEYAEKRILTEQEAAFNQMVLYGKESDWSAVVNACMRYPMFGEKQIVIVKEAQQLKDIEKLSGYISKPLSSTILIIAFKEKKVDSRTVFGKLIKSKTEFLSTKKLYDNQLPDWVEKITSAQGLKIRPGAKDLLIDHIGNDLSRLSNEVNKITLNLKKNEITEDDIENFVGISKEFNVFELQDAIAHKNMAKALRIVQYFAANPKAASIHMVLPVLYGFFSKLYVIAIESPNADREVHSVFRNISAAEAAKQALRNYGLTGIEKIILIMQQYNLKSIGIDQGNQEESGMMTEMIGKMILVC